MRRRIRMLLLAAVVIALAVPFGTALTLDRGAPVPAAVVIQPTTAVAGPVLPRPLTEAGTLLLTGWVLLGLAAIVRRSA
jgi:hypothetical protein